MIQLIDLRKGNLIEYKNEIFEIESIDSASGRTDISFNPPLRNESFQIFNPKLGDLEFIPIEKELLTELGFKYFNDKKGNTFFVNKNIDPFNIVESNGVFRCIVPCFIRITFIHELQNLFFFLKGKEIETSKLITFFKKYI